MTQDMAWNRLEAELAFWPAGTIRLWLRDDDAVAPSPALDRLAALSERFTLPVLLAVIPMLAEPGLAAALRLKPTLLPCQHGCWHRNHAMPGGKKAEFGTERDQGDVLAEIETARLRLCDLLDATPLPIFVPPWNRIDRKLAARLPERGFTGLSCFRGFALTTAGGPILVNTDIDVMDWHGGRIGRPAAALADEMALHLAARRQAGAKAGTLGILLHHRDHDETAWQALDLLLPRLAAHPAVLATDPRRVFAHTPGN